MIYFDNAASSWPKPESVVRRAREWFGENGANPGRSSHRPGASAATAVREARERVCRLLGVADPDRLAFGPGATHALNQAMWGLLEPGDHVVTTVLEHNSVLRPLTALEEERGVEVTAVEPDARGIVPPESVVEALEPSTRLVAVTHASNVLGGVQPIPAIVREVRRQGGDDVRVLVDAAQTAGVVPIDAEAWDVDLLAVAGHKGLFGLQGAGALYVKAGLQLRPLVSGGTGSRSHEARMPEEMPDRLEAGTLNTPGLVALSEGVAWLLERGLDTIREREERLHEKMLTGLREIEGVTVYNPQDAPASTPVALFNVGQGDPEEAAFLYDRRHGIAVRAGVHCAPWAHRWLGTLDREPQGALRASPGFFSTDQELDRFLDATRELVELLPG